MNLEENGATNGAPENNDNGGITCVIVSGDFAMDLLTGRENIKGNSISGVNQETETTVRAPISPDTKLDELFKEICDKYPQVERLILTRSQWEEFVNQYVQTGTLPEIPTTPEMGEK